MVGKQTTKSKKPMTTTKKRKSVNNINNKRRQQGLVNQAVKTGNQLTVIKINNALAKANARVNRRYVGIPKTNPYPQQAGGVVAPSFNIQFPSMAANHDNGMREVYGMRNDILNEFRRLNPNAIYAGPAAAPAGVIQPQPGAPQMGPPPMTEHEDAIYDDSIGPGVSQVGAGGGIGSGTTVVAGVAPPVAGGGVSAGGSAPMSVGGSMGSHPVSIGPEGGSAPMSVGGSMGSHPVSIGPEGGSAPMSVGGSMGSHPPPVGPAGGGGGEAPEAHQDADHVGGGVETPQATGDIPVAENIIDMGDAEEPLIDQLFQDEDQSMSNSSMATSRNTNLRATSTISSRGPAAPEAFAQGAEGEVPANDIDMGDADGAISEVSMGNTSTGSRASTLRTFGPRGTQLEGRHFQAPTGPTHITEPPDEITNGPQPHRRREEVIIDPLMIEQSDEEIMGQRPQAFQESLEQSRLDRLNQGMTPPRSLGMHLADATEQENRRRRRTGSRGLNNRPGATTTLPTVPEQGEGLQPVFDNGNQQNMLEYLNTTDNALVPGPFLDMATFPNVPEGLQEFTFDSADFPSFPEFINNGAPTSPANANTFIDDYLNMSDVPTQQNLLEFQPDTEAQERQRALADQTELDREEMHNMDQPITGPRFSETYKPAKPSSPPRKRIEANRLIAPDTPGEGLTTSRRSRRIEENKEQTPDVQDEIPTKGPLRVRKDTIAAKKRAISQTHANPPTRRSRPPPGALKETPVSSTPPRSISESEPSEETESDTPRRARRRRKPGNAVSSDSTVSDDEPDKNLTRREVKTKVNQFEYEKIWDGAPDKSRIPPSARPEHIGTKHGFDHFLQRKRREGNIPNLLKRDMALANRPLKKDLPQRTSEINRLWKEAEQNGEAFSITPQEFIDRFYENPENDGISFPKSAFDKFRSNKRKEREKANNPNTDTKEQTKKKKKK